jgi:hypothetical protein
MEASVMRTIRPEPATTIHAIVTMQYALETSHTIQVVDLTVILSHIGWRNAPQDQKLG